MPHSNVLDMRMLLSNVGNRRFQTLWESLRLGLKLTPTMLELAVASVIDGLPVVVDDETGNLDVVLGQFVNSVEHLLICETLPKRVPCT